VRGDDRWPSNGTSLLKEQPASARDDSTTFGEYGEPGE
jgi:hypothetical protein